MAVQMREIGGHRDVPRVADDMKAYDRTVGGMNQGLRALVSRVRIDQKVDRVTPEMRHKVMVEHVWMVVLGDGQGQRVTDTAQDGDDVSRRALVMSEIDVLL